MPFIKTEICKFSLFVWPKKFLQSSDEIRTVVPIKKLSDSKGRLFQQSLASVYQNLVLSHFHFAELC